jgi:hypothetical protein
LALAVLKGFQAVVNFGNMSRVFIQWAHEAAPAIWVIEKMASFSSCADQSFIRL